MSHKNKSATMSKSKKITTKQGLNWSNKSWTLLTQMLVEAASPEHAVSGYRSYKYNIHKLG